MGLVSRLRPQFWTATDDTGPYRSLFNYRRIWWLSVALLAAVSLAPLCIMSVIDFNVTKRAVNQENLHRTFITTSNTRRTLAYFLDERLAALNFAAREEAYASLATPERLAELLKDLKAAFGGFMDLGVIDDTGHQVTYVGPYDLLGIDYSNQEWFKKTVESGYFISDIFLGFRNVPHMGISVRADRPGGGFFVLRATVDTQRVNDILNNLDLSGGGDAFLINTAGVLQTVSRSHGSVFEHLNLAVPPPSKRTEVYETTGPANGLIVGYAFIERTPLILMVVKRQAELMKPWYAMRLDLVGFLAGSVCVILLVIVGVATSMVSRIHAADQTRTKTLHQMEHTNRMASIGRLAAGVAHEINNPLTAVYGLAEGIRRRLPAIRAGVDEAMYADIAEYVETILMECRRCRDIVRSMLSFSRPHTLAFSPISLNEVVTDTLNILRGHLEERGRQGLTLTVNLFEGLPLVAGDEAQLKQVLLNLLTNSMDAITGLGEITITTHPENDNTVNLSVEDTGGGIPPENMDKLFNPFFTTKPVGKGIGIGLATCYSIVREHHGSIEVASEVGLGTHFTVKLPLDSGQNRE